MTDKEIQIKNSFFYLLPMILSNLLPLITLPIFTRILTREDYGAWALAQVYATFVGGLCNFGLPIGYERNFFEYKDQKRTGELLYSTLFFVVAALLMSVVFTFFMRSYLSRWIIGSADQGGLLFWCLVGAGVMQVKSYYLIYFKNMEDAKAFVWYTVDESVLIVVFSLLFVVYLRVGVIGLVWGQICGSLIVLVILVIRFFRVFLPAFNFGLLKESLKISFPLTPRIFLGVIGSEFDKYLVRLLGSLGGVGIYSIGQKIGYMVFNYMTAIQNVFSPQVYKRMFNLGSDGGRSIGRYLTPFIYVSIAVAILISLFSQEIIIILTPVSYHGAVDIVTIFSMLYGSMFFAKQPQLIYVKRTYLTSLLFMANILLNVAISIVFIMRWGAIGAAWGALIAWLTYAVILFVISQHYYPIHWEYGKIAAIFLTFFASSLSVIVLRAVNTPYLILLAVKVLAVCIFIGIGIKIGIVSVENYRLVKDMFSRFVRIRFASKGA